MQSENVLISQATKNNWQRLGIEDREIKSRLSKRANKRFSVKKFIPLEYLSDSNNLAIIEKIVNCEKDIQSVIYSLAINLLVSNGLITFDGGKISSKNPYIFEIIENFGIYTPEKELLNIILPQNERDFLGIVYQSMLQEGAKNQKGSYYTPKLVVEKVLASINSTSTFLDPCCGTGSFLLTAAEKIDNPENIYGFDLDKTACFISRINLVLKYKDKIFRPNIFNADFLLFDLDKKFDIIATNPPWGAVISDKYRTKFTEIKSGESFSYFICHCNKFVYLKSRMFFVLPESILNVKVHYDIRHFILENFSILGIQMLGKAFTGVLSDVVMLELSKISHCKMVKIVKKNEVLNICQSFYEKNINNTFSILDNKDAKIIEKIYSKTYLTLQNSIWGLGIVTGNNSKFITSNSIGTEKIYTGKNIIKGGILESEKYIKYEREKFQQTAPEVIYRAPEKLVYKFISKKLVFAYDDEQRLFLNSANILIPRLEGYSIIQVMNCLNSRLFQYIYEKRFNELKVLKGNLCQLPFPCLKNKKKQISDDFLYKYFNLSHEEIEYISSSNL